MGKFYVDFEDENHISFKNCDYANIFIDENNYLRFSNSTSDKHETSRTMTHLENEKLSVQLATVQTQKILHKNESFYAIETNSPIEKILLGKNSRFFYI